MPETVVELVGLGVSEDVNAYSARAAKAVLNESSTNAPVPVAIRDNQEGEVRRDLPIGEHLSETDDSVTFKCHGGDDSWCS